MILEIIVTTIAPDGTPHIAPMGIHRHGETWDILPFKPSKTLENLLVTGHAVVNATDDVRIFAGCIVGKRSFPLVPASKIEGVRLRDALSHTELEVVEYQDDPLRPRLCCRPVHQEHHAPFLGFNRAQHAVIEGAILLSRRHLLRLEEILSEFERLEVLIEKTAGPREREAWQWLCEVLQEQLLRRSSENRP